MACELWVHGHVIFLDAESFVVAFDQQQEGRIVAIRQLKVVGVLISLVNRFAMAVAEVAFLVRNSNEAVTAFRLNPEKAGLVTPGLRSFRA